VHVASGALAAHVGLALKPYLILSVGYEVLEYIVEKNGSNLFKTTSPESPKNIASDLLLGLSAYIIFKRKISNGKKLR